MLSSICLSPVKICVIIVHFGELPPWLPLWQITAEKNHDIDFHLFSDRKGSASARNVIWHDLDLVGFNSLETVNSLGLRLEIPYKLCDVRPAFAKIFPDLVAEYDYWGWGDLDVVYGRIRDCINSSLGVFDYIATGWNGQSGPLAFLRNQERVNSLFLSIPDWQHKMNGAEPRALDEVDFLECLKINVKCDIVFRECLFDLPARFVGGRLVSAFSGREYVLYHFGGNYPSIRASVRRNIDWLRNSLLTGGVVYVDRRGRFHGQFHKVAYFIDKLISRVAG